MSQHATDINQLFQSLDINTVDEACTIDDLAFAFDAAGIIEPSPPSDDTNSASATPSLHIKRVIGPNARYHELHMEYPVYDLLPAGSIPHYARPRDMAYREQPHLATYHIHNTHLGCAVRFNTQLERKYYSSAPRRECQDNFVVLINRLSDVPGVSTLEVMCLEYEAHLVYNMRLSTTWMTAVGQSKETQMYICMFDEFSGLPAALSGVPWADVLDDLVTRASDLSCLFVRDRMIKHSFTAARTECDTIQWRTSSANHILSECFVWHTREEGDNHSQVDVMTFKRCGHVLRISREYLSFVLSHDECVNFHCSQCGSRALGKAALRKIGILEDSRTRAAYVAKDAMWAQWHATLDPYAVFQVRNKELLNALYDALALLKEPTSFMHPSQNAHNTAETGLLLAAFSCRLVNETEALIVAPSKTAHLLSNIAAAALRDFVGVDDSVKGVRYVPLGYGRFMQRWLKGAVVLLAARFEAKTTCVVDALSSMLVMDPPEKFQEKYADVEMTL